MLWKPTCLEQLSLNFAWKLGYWRTKFSINVVSLYWFLILCNLQIIVVLTLVDVGFLKAHLPIGLIPSTTTHYLGLRLEKVYGTWDPACLNGRYPCHLLRKFINVSWQKNSTVHLTSTSPFMAGRMYLVPWFPLTSKVGYLTLVKDPPQWSVIQWLLLMFDINIIYSRMQDCTKVGLVAVEDYMVHDFNKFATISLL